MIPFAAGDKIDLICDHYDNSGKFDDRYLMGSTITVDEKISLTLSDVEITNSDLIYGYRLQDVYNSDRYTPMVSY
jgi:hypothetical protein